MPSFYDVDPFHLGDIATSELTEELRRRGYADFSKFHHYLDDLVGYTRNGDWDRATKSLRNFLFSLTGELLPFRLTKLG